MYNFIFYIKNHFCCIKWENGYSLLHKCAFHFKKNNGLLAMNIVTHFAKEYYDFGFLFICDINAFLFVGFICFLFLWVMGLWLIWILILQVARVSAFSVGVVYGSIKLKYLKVLVPFLSIDFMFLCVNSCSWIVSIIFLDIYALINLEELNCYILLIYLVILIFYRFSHELLS